MNTDNKLDDRSAIWVQKYIPDLSELNSKIVKLDKENIICVKYASRHSFESLSESEALEMIRIFCNKWSTISTLIPCQIKLIMSSEDNKTWTQYKLKYIKINVTNTYDNNKGIIKKLVDGLIKSSNEVLELEYVEYVFSQSKNVDLHNE